MREPGQLVRCSMVCIFQVDLVQRCPCGDLLPGVCDVVDAPDYVVYAYEIVIENGSELVCRLAELVSAAQQDKAAVDLFDHSIGNNSLAADFIFPNPSPLRLPTKNHRAVIGVRGKAGIEEPLV
jgi:hypothetical protein